MLFEFKGKGSSKGSRATITDASPLQGLMARTGSFPLHVAAQIIGIHCEEGSIILDPFCGKGTSLLAARLHQCRAFGCDVAPEAVICASAKQVHVSQFRVLEYVHNLRPRSYRFSEPEPPFLKVFFHPETLEQLVGIREVLLADLLSDSTVRRKYALITLGALLGILHGHATYSLSIPSAHAYSMSSRYVARYAKEHGLTVPERNVKTCLSAKLSKVLTIDIAPSPEHRIIMSDARALSSTFPDIVGKVDLVLTSPPYLNAQTYAKDNWLRHWLLKVDPKALSANYIQTASIARYTAAMSDAALAIATMLRPGGSLVCIAGEVRTRTSAGMISTVDTAEIIANCLRGTGLYEVGKTDVQIISSSRRYYHSLVNSDGHTRVPLVEKTITARRL